MMSLLFSSAPGMRGGGNEQADVSGSLDGEYGSGPPIDPNMFNLRDDMIGFALVFCASMGICLSLNMQKLAHLRNTNAVTGQAEVSFLTLPFWWIAALLNVLSELVRTVPHLFFSPCTHILCPHP